MKKLPFIPAFLLFAFALMAQNSAKKYVLLEHFTNSKCSICATRNPAFYNLIGQAQYADDVHHISIHPPVPYVDCEFYQANTADNLAWAAIYNIQGTPRVALNGRLLPSGSQLLRQDTLNKYVDQTSPLYLKVTETGTGNARSVNIEAVALGQIPAGNYKLFAAVVEKTINKVTPNNEAVHHDVFRDMLTPVTGQDITVPAQGQSTEFNFNYNITSPWNANEVYVVAFIKETNTNQVLNSGTKFDPVLLLGASAPAAKSIVFSPNPATAITYANLGDDLALRTEVFGVNGQRVYSNTENQSASVAVPATSFAPGIYFVKITGEKAIYTAKMVKE